LITNLSSFGNTFHFRRKVEKLPFITQIIPP